jgi:hypothetical protein
VFTTSFLVLTAIIFGAGLFILRATRSHKVEEAELTADELKTFNERFRFKSRVEMPTRYQAIAATADRLRRTSILGCLAVIAGIAYVIIAGPSQ